MIDIASLGIVVDSRQIEKGKKTLDEFAKEGEQSEKRITKATTLMSSGFSSLYKIIGTFSLAAVIGQTVAATKEINRYSQALGVSQKTLSAMGFASETVGISSQKMGDILKDLSDKIGDAYLNKGGEALEALNNLGLSAEQLNKMSPDRQLMAIASALGSIQDKGSKVQIMEALANDASLLLPLLDDNAKGMRALMEQADSLGATLSELETQKIMRLSSSFNQLKGVAFGLGQNLVSAIADPLNSGISEITGFVGKISKAFETGFAFDFIEAKLAEFLGSSKSAFSEIVEFGKGYFSALGEHTAHILGFIGETFMELPSNAIVAYTIIKEKINQFFTWMLGELDKAANVDAKHWETIKYYSEQAWLGIKLAAAEAIDYVIGKMAAMVETVGNGVSSLDWIPGIESAKESVDSAAESMRSYATASESVEDAIAQSTSSHKKAISSIEESNAAIRKNTKELLDASESRITSAYAEKEAAKESAAQLLKEAKAKRDATLETEKQGEMYDLTSEKLNNFLGTLKKGEPLSKEEIKQRKEAAKASQLLTAKMDDEIAKLKEHNLELKGDGRAAYKAKLETEGFTQAKIDSALALWDENKLLEQNKKRYAEMGEVAKDKALEIQRAHAEAAKNSLDKWASALDDVSDSITDAIFDAFQEGSNIVDSFLTGIKKLFAETVLQPTIKGIVTSGAAAMGLGPQAAVASPVGAGGFSPFSPLSMIGGGFGSAVMGLGSSLVGMGATGLGAGVLASGGAFATQGIIGGAMSSLGAAGSALSAGSFATAIGAAVPVVAPLAIAAVLASGLFESKTWTGVGVKTGEKFVSDPYHGSEDDLSGTERFAVGKSAFGGISIGISRRGDWTADQIQKFTDEQKATVAAISELDNAIAKTLTEAEFELAKAASQVNKSKVEDLDIAATIDKRYTQIFAAIGGEMEAAFNTLVGSGDTVLNAAAATATIAAATGEFKDILDFALTNIELIANGTAQGESVGQALIRVSQEFIYANQTLSTLGLAAFNVSESGLTASQSLIAAAGGFEQFAASASFFYQNFYTEEERAQKTIELTAEKLAQFNSEFVLTGETAVKTKDDLRSLVEGLDLTTEAGQKLYSAAMALAPALVEAANASDILNKQSAESNTDAPQENKPEVISSLTKSASEFVAPWKKAAETAVEIAESISPSFDELAALMERMKDESDKFALSDFDYRMSQINKQWEETREKAIALSASQEQLSIVDQRYQLEIDDLIASQQSAAESTGELANKAKEAGDLLQDLSDQLSEMRSSEYGNELSAIRAQTQEYIRTLAELEQATERNIAAVMKWQAAMTAQAAFGQLEKTIAKEKENIESNYKTQVDAENERYQAAIALAKETADKEKRLVEEKFNAISNSISVSISNVSEKVSGLRNISELLKGTLQGLGLNTLEEMRYNRAQGQSYIKSALSGNYTQEDLQSALSAITEPSNDLFGSFEDYARDFYRTANDIDDLSKMTDSQLSDAESQLAALERGLEQSQHNFDIQMTKLDENLAAELSAEELLNTANLAKLEKEFGTQNGILDTILANAKEQVSGILYVGDNILSLSDAVSELSAAVLSYNQIESPRTPMAPSSAIPGFATGGRHSGGWRIVGEVGPELEYTGPSSIVPNSESLFDVSELLDEIRKLREEQRAANFNIVMNTLKTAKQVEKWDGDGLPETRTV